MGETRSPGLADVSEIHAWQVIGPKTPCRRVQQTLGPARIEQSLHVVCSFFPCRVSPSGFRDMTKAALAGDVSPRLSHTVGCSRPWVVEHLVVAIICAEASTQFAGRFAPPRVVDWLLLHGSSLFGLKNKTVPSLATVPNGPSCPSSGRSTYWPTGIGASRMSRRVGHHVATWRVGSFGRVSIEGW